MTEPEAGAAEQQYDPDAPPLALDTVAPVEDPEQHALRDVLWSLRRIAHAQEALKIQREELMPFALEVFQRLKRPVAVLDPTTGEPLVSTYRQNTTVKVDPQELYAALLQHYGDAVKATSVLQRCLKDPEVDTKDGGRFHQAQEEGLIPLHVVKQVAQLKPSAAYVGFSKPVR